MRLTIHGGDGRVVSVELAIVGGGGREVFVVELLGSCVGGVRGAPVSLPIRGGGSRHVELFCVLEMLRVDSVVELLSTVLLFEAAYVCVIMPATVAIATSANRIILSLFLYIESPLRFCVAPSV